MYLSHAFSYNLLGAKILRFEDKIVQSTFTDSIKTRKGACSNLFIYTLFPLIKVKTLLRGYRFSPNPGRPQIRTWGGKSENHIQNGKIYHQINDPIKMIVHPRYLGKFDRIWIIPLIIQVLSKILMINVSEKQYLLDWKQPIKIE